MAFSRSSAAIPSYPLGQTEAEADSERWRGDAARAAARLHREDLHLARVNSALFQISNDVLSSSMADVHLRAEAVLRSEERPPNQPTDDADLNRLYRAMWAMEVLLDESAGDLNMSRIVRSLSLRRMTTCAVGSVKGLPLFIACLPVLR